MSRRASTKLLLLSLLISLFISACSRSYDIDEDAGFPEETSIECAPVADSSIVFVDNLFFDSALVTPLFNQDTLEYSAQVGYPVESVRARVRVPSLLPDDTTVRSITLQIGEENVDFDLFSDPITLTTGENIVTFTVNANVRTEPYSDACIAESVENEFELPAFIDVERVYQVTITRSALVDTAGQFLAATIGPDAGDRFGSAVAMHDDVIAIGSPFEDSSVPAIQSFADFVADDNSVPDSGAVFLFERDLSGDWNPQRVIKAPQVGSGDAFGSAIAIGESWMAIAAPGEDSISAGAFAIDDPTLQLGNDLASDSGAVYVYQRLGESWQLHSVLKKPLNDASADGYDDEFGHALVVNGDEILIASPGEDSATGGDLSDNTTNDAGAVIVFRFDAITNEWRFATEVKSDYARAGDRFGTAMSIFGGELVVSAPGEDSDFRGISSDVVNVTDDVVTGPREENVGRVDSGAVYLFERTGDQYIFETVFKSSNSDSGDAFGTALALNDNVLVVGASLEDGNGQAINRNLATNDRPASGAVYVFDRSNANWAESAYLKSFNSAAGDRFGQALALLDNDLVVAAPRHDEGFTNNGAVYYFDRSGGNWVNRDFLELGRSDGARAGHTVLLSNERIVIGSRTYSESGSGVTAAESGDVRVLDFQ